MGSDNSRCTFNPRNDYSGVVMQQGRVQLDSDWNEWLAELVRHTQAGTLDIALDGHLRLSDQQIAMLGGQKSESPTSQENSPR